METLPGKLRACGTAFSIDVNYRSGVWSVTEAAHVLLALARQADYVFVGLDEANVLWNTTTPEGVFDLVRPIGKLIVKDGAVGATQIGPETAVFVPSPTIKVVEEVGAGDAFAAGYLGATLKGSGPREALQSGHEFAARALQSTSDFVSLNET